MAGAKRRHPPAGVAVATAELFSQNTHRPMVATEGTPIATYAAIDQSGEVEYVGHHGSAYSVLHIIAGSLFRDAGDGLEVYEIPDALAEDTEGIKAYVYGRHPDASQ